MEALLSRLLLLALEGFLQGLGRRSRRELSIRLRAEARLGVSVVVVTSGEGDTPDFVRHVVRADGAEVVGQTYSEKLLQSAQSGDVASQFSLGLCYHFGYGIAADNGDTEAQDVLWGRFFKDKCRARFRQENPPWWLLPANQELVDAKLDVWYLFLRAEELEGTFEQEIRWLRLAADQGQPTARHNLALYLSEGIRMPANPVEALKLWRSAAEKNEPYAMLNLGSRYAKGSGVTQDYAEAYFWLLLAAASGESSSLEKEVAAHLTPEQIAGAEERVRKYLEAHRK